MVSPVSMGHHMMASPTNKGLYLSPEWVNKKKSYILLNKKKKESVQTDFFYPYF